MINTLMDKQKKILTLKLSTRKFSYPRKRCCPTTSQKIAQNRHTKKTSKLGRKELLAHALGRTVIGGGMVHSQIALASKALEC